VQAVDLNLATRPFKNDTLLWIGLVVAVALLGFLSWWNVTTWREHRRLLADLRESQISIGERFGALDRRDQQALRQVDAVDLPVLVTKADKANEVIRWKSFSWTRLFNLLQEIQPWDVQMTSIHPVFRGDRRGARNELEDLEQVPVSVEGTAKTLRDFLAFERALIFDPHFDRVEPDNIATDDNSGETIFRLRFLYDPRVGVEAELPADQIAEGEGDAAAPDGADAEAVGQAQAEEVDRPAAAEATPELAESGELASDNLKKIRRGDRKGRGKRADAASGSDASPQATPTGPSPATVSAPADPSRPGVGDATQNAAPPQVAEEIEAQAPGSEQVAEEIGAQAPGSEPAGEEIEAQGPGSEPAAEVAAPRVGDATPGRPDRSLAPNSSRGRDRSADDEDEERR
jgi:hypothetical protein